MGELADDFRFMDEQRKKHKVAETPNRMEYAKKLLAENGHTVTHSDSGLLNVNGYIKLWVFTGWWSGKGIGSGRGIHNLIKALNKKA